MMITTQQIPAMLALWEKNREKKVFARQKAGKIETVATLPAGWDSANAIRLGNKPFAELGANSEALSGSQVDSPCSLPSDPRICPGNVAIVSKNRQLLGERLPE